MTEHGKHIGEVFQDKGGQWRWRVKSWTGENVAASEAYYSRSNAKRGLLAANPTARPAADQTGGRGVWRYEVN